MTENLSPTTTRLAKLFPLSVLLLAPEFVTAVLWIFWFVLGSINEGEFGRTMESRAGLGIIYTILVYGAMIVVGMSTLAFIVWRVIKGISMAKGLLAASERARRAVIATNLVHIVFIITAFFVCNFCNLPGRAAEAGRSPCSESTARRAVQALDLLVLTYGAFAIYSFTRPRTTRQFTRP